MHYDPIKRALGNVFNRTPVLRRLFYRMLDLLLLRAWHIHKALRSWEKSCPENGLHVLDAGSGFGQYVYYLSQRHPRWPIHAVDVKQEQVDDCNAFFTAIGAVQVKFETADLTKFRQDNTYDLVLSVDVMEHILEDVQVFQNLYASMKKGGMLLISTPSDQGGSDVHGEEEGSFIEEHVRDGYNMQDIETKLKSAGFANVEASYSYGAPGKISWKLSMKYPILMLGASKIFFLVLPFYYLLFFPFCLVLNYLDVHTRHTSGTGLIVKAWK